MRSVCFTLCLFLSLGASAIQNAVELQSPTANEHILKRVEPEYPAMAKAARLQGSVVLRVTISPEGSVTSVGIVSGHPMLTAAAVNAVKQWQYQPFVVKGRAATVKTTIEVPFSLGISEAEYKNEQQAADAYFKEENKCRELVNAGRCADAEPVCKLGVELAEKLPATRAMERVTAYQQAGHSMFYQEKFSDALNLYQRELALAESTVQPYDAELGYAYHHVAIGLHATGDLTKARSYYERAEATLESAREHIDSEFLKNRYSGSIKSVLADYVVLLRQMGDESGAQAAEQRAKSIIVKTNLNKD